MTGLPEKPAGLVDLEFGRRPCEETQAGWNAMLVRRADSEITTGNSDDMNNYHLRFPNQEVDRGFPQVSFPAKKQRELGQWTQTVSGAVFKDAKMWLDWPCDSFAVAFPAFNARLRFFDRFAEVDMKPLRALRLRRFFGTSLAPNGQKRKRAHEAISVSP